MKEIVDVSQLPSATKARFALLLTLGLVAAFGLGQDNAYYLSNEAWPPAYRSLFSGSIVAATALVGALLYYLFHSYFRSLSFGKAAELDSSDALSQRIKEICNLLQVKPPRLLMDTDIRNYDALAFGGPFQKTILMGRGLRLLRAAKPDQFDARLAHEIGHIHNGDIATTFIAEGLIGILIVLFSIAIGVFMWKAAIIFAASWQQWFAGAITGEAFAHWLGLIADWGIAGILTTLLWALILFSEQHSFLRVRELYADNVASVVFGSAPIKQTLGQQPNVSSSSFLSRLYHSLYDAHPSVEFRRAVVDDPLLLHQPTPSRFVRIGYAIGLLYAVVFSIRDLPKPEAKTLDEFLKAAMTTAAGAELSLFSILIFLPAVLAVGSLILRTTCWVWLTERPVTERIAKLLKAALAVIPGIVVGIYLNPVTIEMCLRGGAQAMHSITSDFGRAGVGFGTAAQIILILLICIPTARRLLTAPRSSRPTTFSWILIGITFYFALGYLSGGIYALFDSDVAKRGDTISLALAMAGIGLFFWSVGYLVARGTLRPGRISTRSISKWVYRPNFNVEPQPTV